MNLVSRMWRPNVSVSEYRPARHGTLLLRLREAQIWSGGNFGTGSRSRSAPFLQRLRDERTRLEEGVARYSRFRGRSGDRPLPPPPRVVDPPKLPSFGIDTVSDTYRDWKRLLTPERLGPAVSQPAPCIQGVMVDISAPCAASGLSKENPDPVAPAPSGSDAAESRGDPSLACFRLGRQVQFTTGTDGVHEALVEVRHRGKVENPAEYEGESMFLFLEEAMFLASPVGGARLHIRDDSSPEPSLSAQSLWQRCVSAQPNFAARLAVYANLRQLSWVVRDGRIFGVDFALYEQGPACDHAAHLVLLQHDGVHVSDPGAASDLPPRTKRACTWRTLQGAARVTHSARKNLLLARVFAPTPPSGETDLGQWLPTVTVQLASIRRFRVESEGERQRVAKVAQQGRSRTRAPTALPPIQVPWMMERRDREWMLTPREWVQPGILDSSV